MGYKWAKNYLTEGEQMSIQSPEHQSSTHPFPYTDAVLVEKKDGKIRILEEVDGIR